MEMGNFPQDRVQCQVSIRWKEGRRWRTTGSHVRSTSCSRRGGRVCQRIRSVISRRRTWPGRRTRWELTWSASAPIEGPSLATGAKNTVVAEATATPCSMVPRRRPRTEDIARITIRTMPARLVYLPLSTPAIRIQVEIRMKKTFIFCFYLWNVSLLLCQISFLSKNNDFLNN